MADIFISYAHEDKERVAPIVDELEKIGWSVFWDRTIPPGKDWLSYIEKKLEVSSCVVVVWSASSVKSAKDNWVLDEAVEAKKRDILVPLRIDEVDPPFGFRRAQSADLSHWEKNSAEPDFQQLVAAISDIIPVPQNSSLPEALPPAVVKVAPAEPELKIGDKFGGGKIAFMDTTGKHGLIAAEADLPGGDKYIWEVAKKACEDLRENGFNDWYLPSKDELNKLYRHKRAVGGFSVHFYYWSSTELDAHTAWNQYFGDGSQDTNAKDVKWRVRPVRAF